MGNVMTYSGIVTKVRAMQAKLLTDSGQGQAGEKEKRERSQHKKSSLGRKKADAFCDLEITEVISFSKAF